MAEFVVTDMTTANPNVFYELGVRHAARPYTTIALYATLGAPPFDVNMVRAIPYELAGGRLGDAAAAALRDAIAGRIRAALQSPVAKDSPLFQLFDGYPGITMSHELTDVFRDRVAYSQEFKDKLAAARALKPQPSARDALRAIESSLGDIKTAERGIVVDLLLSYRAAGDFDAMIMLFDRMSGDVRDAPLAQQQLAFALNRRDASGDRDRAIRVLRNLIALHGDSAETLGLLGRIYKDRFRAAAPGSAEAKGWLEQAIKTYTRGFESEPLDFYPGVNALTLLVLSDDETTDREIGRLAPLVTFAALRRGGEESDDYWMVATVLELACITRDEKLARRCLPRAIMLAEQARESWMRNTTADNLALIAARWASEPAARFVREIELEMRPSAAG
jgi:tetratricopeptide (TPR) repeat protein